MPLVSIIVPTFNAEQYLKQCIESIINQTLKDLEIIIVNDGSTDNSLQVAEDFSNKDNRIKVINKSNGGYGSAMNAGLNIATGEYIGIVDADDYILDKMYETLYHIASYYNLDIAGSAYNKFYNRSNGTIYKSYWSIAGNEYRNKVFCPSEMLMPSMPAVLTPACIFKKSFIFNNKINWNETPGASFQDQGFWFKTFCLADRVMYLSDAFYMYRMDNLSSSIHNKEALNKMIAEYKLIHEWLSKCPTKYIHFAKVLYWKAFYSACTVVYGRNFTNINTSTLKPFSAAFTNDEVDSSAFSKIYLSRLQLLRNNPKKFCNLLKQSSIIKSFELYTNIKGVGNSTILDKIIWYIKYVGVISSLYYITIHTSLKLKQFLKKQFLKIGLFTYKSIVQKLPYHKQFITNNSNLNKFFSLKPHTDYRSEYMFWLSEMHRQNVDNIKTAQLKYFKEMPRATGHLRERQDNYLLLLSQLKEVLDANNLPFWPMGGTLIGAVRHSGFIPWDDDIDISMYYSDKDKLFDVVSKDNRFRIFDVYWCHGNNTFLRCPRVVFRDSSNGDACIDIFLWEQANFEPTGYMPLWNKRNAAVKWMIEQYINKRPLLHKKQYINEEIVDYHDKEIIESIFDEGRNRCVSSIGTSENGTTFYGCVDMLYERGKWLAVYDKTCFEPFIKGNLENISISVPNSYDQMLNDQYGSWLTLPKKVTPNHGG